MKPATPSNLEQQILTLSQRYYNTKDLAQLGPRQLDRLTTMATRINPNTQAKISGKKYSGRTRKQLKKIF